MVAVGSAVRSIREADNGNRRVFVRKNAEKKIKLLEIVVIGKRTEKD